MWGWLAAVASWTVHAGPDRALEVPPVVPVSPVSLERRRALVIGNGAYQTVTRLAQAPGDARTIAKTLEGLGFEVELVVDANQAAMRKAFADFDVALAGAGVGFFYYAGHAIQVDGVNYLIPVDSKLKDPRYVDVEAVDTRIVQRALESTSTAVAVLVLDACRVNPFAATWTDTTRSFGSQGLAQFSARGLLVAYATNPNNTATDSGVYATSLARHLATPCQNIMDVFYQVRDEVLTATGGEQTPWIGGSPGMAFSRFVPAGCDGAAPTVTPPAPVPSPVPAPVRSSRFAELEATLAAARALYQRRCVVELGRMSTAGERKRCHDRYHPRVQAAQDALDDALLADRPGSAPRPRPE